MDRLHQLIDDHPGSDPAVIDCDGQAIDFATLRHEAAALADLLSNHGIRPGDRVILVAENCALYALVVLAASRLSAWLTLVNARQSAAELEATIAHSGARAVIFTTHASQAASDHAHRLGGAVIGQTCAGPVCMTPTSPSEPEPVEDGPHQVAVLLYTTGTTSAPKGVMLTHDNLIFCAANGAKYFGTRPDDRTLMVLPGTHIYALSSVFLNTMAAGASIRFVSRFDPVEVLGILRGGITRFPGVPQMMGAIMAHLDKTREPLGADRLRFMVTGGAPLDPGLKAKVEKVFGLPLNNGYGMTELAPSISSTHPDQPRDDVSVGVPYPWIDVRIADPDADGIGEIQVRGRNVMKGYYKAPDKTAEVMTDDGFFRTGDLGRFDDGGGLHIAGRLKELIIRSGFNVHPPEIEAMLSRHPDVYSVAVVGRPVPGNEEILAFVKTGGKTSGAELRDWLKERLVGYKVPQAVFVVEDWPAAATGKPLKHKLLAHFAGMIDDWAAA